MLASPQICVLHGVSGGVNAAVGGTITGLDVPGTLVFAMFGTESSQLVGPGDCFIG